LPSITRGQLSSLRNELKLSTSKMSDRMSKYHILDLVSRIGEALDPK
jgi:hypothetical protein